MPPDLFPRAQRACAWVAGKASFPLLDRTHRASLFDHPLDHGPNHTTGAKEMERVGRESLEGIFSHQRATESLHASGVSLTAHGGVQ